jgi:hypothetical protein
MKFGVHWKHIPSLLFLLLGSGISIVFGLALDRSSPGGMMGFPGIYYGTRCLLEHGDPYIPAQLESFYQQAGAGVPAESVARRQAVTLYVNLPTTFLFVAPLALLPLKLASALWMIVLIGSFLTAALLMWDLGAVHARNLSTLLAFILLANCQVLFAGGNTAGIVIGFCVIAVWCFLRNRYAWAGVPCLAIALAMKPHDVGLIWLFFLLSGGVYRKRALQSAAIAMVLVAAAVLWVSVVAPHWLTELRANLTTISSPGGINEPGPRSIGVSSGDMIIDLQTVFSIVRDKPGFYNAATYLVCGAIFLLWASAVRRVRLSLQTAWPALAAAAALSMLVTYHRSYDARLLMLAIPACAMLWRRGGRVAWIGLALTTAAITITGDIPLAIVALATSHLPMTGSAGGAKLAAIFLGRPAPLLLLATAIFYLWVLARNARTENSPLSGEPRSQRDCA